MGVLRHGNATVTLSERTLVGRAAGCALRLDDARVSGEHALIAWSRGGWTVRDLGSRNGTFVDGKPLGSGERAQLSKGSRLGFVDPEGDWILEEAHAPTAHARPLDGGPGRTADGDVLALPDDDDVELTILLDAQGRWMAEGAGGESRRVADLSTVQAGGRTWRLHLPQRLDPTVAAESLPALCLELEVSPDEEVVEITVVEPQRRTRLKPRAHHYFLLTLARERLRGDGPDDERGWVGEDDIARMLRLDRQTVKVQIHRSRQEFGRLGVVGAHDIVERRAGTGLMRIGVPHLSVRTRGT